MEKRNEVQAQRTRCDLCGELSSVITDEGKAYCSDCSSLTKRGSKEDTPLKSSTEELAKLHKS